MSLATRSPSSSTKPWRTRRLAGFALGAISRITLGSRRRTLRRSHRVTASARRALVSPSARSCSRVRAASSWDMASMSDRSLWSLRSMSGLASTKPQ
jgi:hypothetical protein